MCVDLQLAGGKLAYLTPSARSEWRACSTISLASLFGELQDANTYLMNDTLSAETQGCNV
jgi:hypothetical protein